MKSENPKSSSCLALGAAFATVALPKSPQSSSEGAADLVTFGWACGANQSSPSPNPTVFELPDSSGMFKRGGVTLEDLSDSLISIFFLGLGVSSSSSSNSKGLSNAFALFFEESSSFALLFFFFLPSSSSLAFAFLGASSSSLLFDLPFFAPSSSSDS